jgi:hypothetical protein
MSYHVLRNANIIIDFAIVYLKHETDKVGQDRSTSRLRLDRRHSLAWFGSDDGQATRSKQGSSTLLMCIWMG